MEKRIHVEVAEFITQARLTTGQPFDPNKLIHRCVVNVIISIVLGRRYPYGHPSLVNLQDLIHQVFASVVVEVEFFEFLRFIPPFRDPFKKYLNAMASLTKAVVQEVRQTICAFD